MLDVEALSEMMAGVVADEVGKALAPLQARIAELEARDPVAGPPGEKGESGPRGEDGASPEPEAVAAALLPIAGDIISDAVAKAVAALPAPEKGDTGERGEKGEPGKNGTDGEAGADGRGVKDLLIDRDGQLVASMDDGEMKTLGPVVGKDGLPGKDGRDGFSLEDFGCRVLEDDRTLELSFRSGEVEHVATLKWPTVIDRGVYKAGETYEPGDAVTWGGSLWIAQRQTDAKPDTAESGFRLAVKRGRDGKDARG